MLEYLYSNKPLIVLLILIPFVLSTSFGYILHSEANLGYDYTKELNLSPKYDHGQTFPNFKNSTLINQFYEKHFNDSTVRPSLKSLKQIRFYRSLFGSLQQTSSVSIILGGMIALISGGKMVNDKSIIYLMVNKKTRSRSFGEFFFTPLPFLVSVLVLTSLSITTISLNSYIEVSSIKIFGLAFFVLMSSALEGYILANFFVLLIRNNTLSLLGLFGVVFVLPIFSKGKLVVLLFSYIGKKLFYDIPLPLENYIYLGCLILLLLPLASYYIFKRGDFYK